jgi:hypothetical protein
MAAKIWAKVISLCAIICCFLCFYFVDVQKTLNEWKSSVDRNLSFIWNNSTRNALTYVGIQLHPELVLTQDNYMRRWPLKMTNLDYEYIHQPQHPCKGSVKLLLIVFTLPSDFQVRDTIRQTWGSIVKTGRVPGSIVDYPGVEVYFILGMSDVSMAGIFKEIHKYDDIILADFHEDYQNLTLKTLLSLKWANANCPNAEFVGKVDKDVFVHIPILYPVLTRNLTSSMIGHVFRGARVVRHKKHKCFVPSEHFPFRVYPPYASGSFYVIGGRLVPQVLDVVEYVPPFSVEDALVTGVVREMIGAPIVVLECFKHVHGNITDLCGVALGGKCGLKTIWADVTGDLESKKTPKC